MIRNHAGPAELFLDAVAELIGRNRLAMGDERHLWRRAEPMQPAQDFVGIGKCVTAVIEMGMGQNHGVDAAWRNSKRRPVLETKGLETLKETATHERPGGPALEVVFRPGNGARSAQK